MKINIQFIEADNDFSKGVKVLIGKIIREDSAKVAKILPFETKVFTFTVYPWKRKGAHGFAQATDWVRIMLNPKELDFKKGIKQKILDRLAYLVYHEMHHASRGYVGFLPEGKNHMLINSVLSEGLADVFAQECAPNVYDSEKLASKDRQIENWICRMDKIKWRKMSAYYSWAYGGEGKPALLGYKMGRYIILALKKKHPEWDAVKLVRTDAKKILKLSGVKFR
ncbi:MAG: DUF2268 domain-containing putative Zn-dependent protease [Parcubacteria group bacterium]|jgi:uncharacterized protein YjaZ